MNSFAEDLAESWHLEPKPCRVQKWLDTLHSADQDEFFRYLRDDLGSVANLFRVSKKHGFTGGETAFKGHINKVCSCWRNAE